MAESETRPKGAKHVRDITDSFFHNQIWIDFYHVPSDQSVEFKAYLTDFSDNYEASWNEEEVYGRNDPLVTFEGTSRDIDLGWSVVASSGYEAKQNMKRMSLLVNMLYPHYSVPSDEDKSISSTSISAAPLLKIRMMNWIQDGSDNQNGKSRAKGAGLLGKPDGISFEPNLEQGVVWNDDVEEPQPPGSINLDEGELGEDVGVPTYQMYPKEFDLSMNFVVNHTHPLGWDKSKPRTSTFPYGEQLDDKEYLVRQSNFSDKAKEPENLRDGRAKISKIVEQQDGISNRKIATHSNYTREEIEEWRNKQERKDELAQFPLPEKSQ